MLKIAIFSCIVFMCGYWFIAGLIRSMIDDVKAHSAIGMFLRTMVSLAVVALLRRWWF